MTSVNVLRSILDIFGSESVTNNKSKLTVMGNKSETPVMTGIMALAMIG